MTIIGLKTVDNGTQGLSPAHSHPNCYPHTRPARTSPLVFSSSCPSRQNRSLVSSLFASNFPGVLPNYCGTVMNSQQTLTNTHAHSRLLSPLQPTLTPSPLFVFSQRALTCVAIGINPAFLPTVEVTLLTPSCTGTTRGGVHTPPRARQERCVK